MISDLELMEHHVNVLFRHDQDNRIRVVNEPPYEVAPKIFIGGTKFGNVLRFSNTLDGSLIHKLEQQVVGEKNPGIDLGKLIKIYLTYYQIDDLSMGPAYVFPVVRDRVNPIEVIQVTDENKEILKEGFPYTFEDFEFKQPCFGIVKNSRLVSLCCSARQTNLAAEASVYTHKDYRGRDYGMSVTNQWAKEVQKQGRIALYRLLGITMHHKLLQGNCN